MRKKYFSYSWVSSEAVTPEQELWLNVVQRGILDLVYYEEHGFTSYMSSVKDVNSAREFFEHDTFKEFCEHLDFNFDYIYPFIKKVIPNYV